MSESVMRRVVVGVTAVVVLLSALGLSLGVGFGSSASAWAATGGRGLPGQAAQPGDGPGSTTSVTTSRDVRDSGAAPAAASTSTTSVADARVGGVSTKATTTVNYKVWGIVAALVVVALLILWWTVHYWRVTDPRGARAPERAVEEADRAARRGGGREDRKRRSRYSDLVITVTHPDDKEPTRRG